MSTTEIHKRHRLDAPALRGRADAPIDEQELFARRIVLVATRSQETQITSTVLALVTAVVAWRLLPGVQVLSWFALMTTITMVRFVATRRFLEDPRTRDVPRYALALRTSMLLAGLGWSVSGVALSLMPSIDAASMSVVLFCCAGIPASVVNTYAAYRNGGMVLVSALLWPIAIAQFSYLEWTRAAAGAGALFYWVFLFRVTTAQENDTVGMMRLDMERELLVENLRLALRNAEAADVAKSQFLATMSHEIRTPMNGVLGMAELLARTSLDARQQRFLQTILKSGTSLVALINDLLDFSRIEAGQMELVSEPLDVGAVIEDVVVAAAPAAHGKGLELIVDLAAEPLRVQGDGMRLRQVIENLVGNAVKFTDRGTVSVHARWAADASPGAAPRLRVEVRDTGIGIDAESQAAVFERFRQLDGSSTRSAGGTGLGLAICRQLVTLMGGQMGVDSRPGSGSTFWFEVTLQALAEPDRPRDVDERCEKQVLVLARHALQADVLARELRRLGFCNVEARCIDAATLDDAPTWVPGRGDDEPGRREDTGAFGALVVDLGRASTLRGWLQRARTQPALRDARVLALTDCLADDGADDDLGDLLASASVDARLTKPLRRAELAAAARELRGWLAAPAERAPRQASALDAAARRPHVLLAESNAVSQEVSRSALEALGCRVTAVEGGRTAIAAACDHREHYELILLDVDDPAVDGVAAARDIRRWEAEHDTRSACPIIALASALLPADRLRYSAAGVSDFLGRPFSPPALAAAVRRWIAPLPTTLIPEARERARDVHARN